MASPKWTPGQVHQVDVSWLNLFEAFGATGAFFSAERTDVLWGAMATCVYHVILYWDILGISS